MNLLIPLVFLILATGVAACFPMSNPVLMLRVPVITSLVILALSISMAMHLFESGAYLLYGGNFLVDSLSMYHIFLVNFIFLISSVYATGYFKKNQTSAYIKRYCMLWQTFHAMLLLALLSNNIGLMWISLEATTLVSAFLIVSDSNPLSIEAMWKYLLVCSVGIAFAFFGTILTVAAARDIPSPHALYLFSQLGQHAGLIHPKLMLLAFIFIVVGFGTKAGFAPMHTWLPDAHSQAPTPVSAVFSGVMLNCALFAIMRYLPITEAALGKDGQAHSILLLLGFTSLIFAAVFIPIQHDMKRLLAYHSVEHMGIIAVGLGIGGFGTFAALLHITNHSLSKVLAFFSAGHIGEHYGTRDMRQITGAVKRVPLWGISFFVSILVLIGVAPFSVFMSEFLIIKEAFFKGRYFVVGLFLFAALAVFISALKHAMDVSFGECKPEQAVAEKGRFIDKKIVLVCMAALLLLGLWIPSPFADFLKSASAIIEEGINL
ncbi:MAG: proton-conducting transporter membrane subunit [bacterium]